MKPSHFIRPFAWSLAMVIALAVGGCATAWPPLSVDALPGAKDFPHDDQVVLMHHVDARWVIDDATGEPIEETTHHMRLRVLTRDGRDGLRNYAVGYDPELGELVDFQARVVDAKGDRLITEFGDQAIEDGWMTSGRFRYPKLGDLKVGDVVELRWTKRSRVNFAPISWEYADGDPVRDARFTLHVAPGQTVAHRHVVFGVDTPVAPVEAATDDGGRTLTWDMGEVPRVASGHAYTPAWGTERVLHVALRGFERAGEQVAWFDEWADYGPWFSKLSAGVFEPNEALKATVARVLEGAPDDPRERARRLFRHVQETVRYVSIQLGLGGWRPMPAAEVDANQYGDCKAMAGYVRSLLAVDGIESSTVTVGTVNKLPAQSPSPNLRQFNHQILALHLDDEILFLDPTCRTCAFGKARWDDEGAGALLYGEETARVVTIPQSPSEENASEFRFDVTVDADGGAEVQLEMTFEGHPATWWRGRLLNQNPREREESMRRMLSDRGQRQVSSWSVEALEDLDAPLVLRVAGRVRGLMEGGSGIRTLASAFLQGAEVKRLRSHRPKIPAFLAYKRANRLEVKVQLPRGSRVMHVPEDSDLSSPYGRLRRTITARGDTVTLVRTLTLDAVVVPAEGVSALQTFTNDVLTADREPVVLQLPRRP